MLLCQNSHVLEHIEGKENKIFVIKIRKVNLTKPEFYEGKGFCLFHSLLCILALEQCLLHDLFKYSLNENNF